ncbi:MAG: ribosome maturation factor RimM [Bacteroidales bacterium]|nr:ribosome maturation factor RimM [Bacteroidales bacterium]MDZ4205226.1 ribosome maturation factor RimM [Bacteroidales bacterium]
MKAEGYYYLGKILRLLGTKGEMLVYLDVDDPGNYETLDMVFVLVGGNMVPFEVANIKLRHNNQVHLTLQDVDDTEQAEVLVGCSIYLPLSALPVLTDNQFYYHEIIGYEVVDEVYGFIGTVEQVLDYPLQALLQVSKEGKEILIPIVDEIITWVDKKNRCMHIKAPEGLVDIYLE